MQNIIANLLVAVVVLALLSIPYLLCTFVVWEWNLWSWPNEIKAIFIACYLLAGVGKINKQ
jgi:hypothetical protein